MRAITASNGVSVSVGAPRRRPSVECRQYKVDGSAKRVVAVLLEVQLHVHARGRRQRALLPREGGGGGIRVQHLCGDRNIGPAARGQPAPPHHAPPFREAWGRECRPAGPSQGLWPVQPLH